MFDNLNLVKSYAKTNPNVFVFGLWKEYSRGLTSFGQYMFVSFVFFTCSENTIIFLQNSNFTIIRPCAWESRMENPQKLTQLSSRSHPRHLLGKRTAQKDTIIDITSDSQVNSNFPYRWSPASLTFNNYFYPFLYLYIT